MPYRADDRISAFFAHHGIKGQKWGVRRFQNTDGSLTEEGTKRYRAISRVKKNAGSISDIENIYKSLSYKERRLLTGSADDYFFTPGQELDESSNIAKLSVIKDKKGNPVSFAQLFDNGKRHGEIALATKNDKQYRHKGYGSIAVKEVMDYYDKYGYKYLDDIFWTPHKTNTASINMGKKFGFEEVKLKDIPGIYPEDPNNEYVYLRYSKQKGGVQK